MKKLDNLKKWLKTNGFHRESRYVDAITSYASDMIRYRVIPGDTLSGIAEKFGFTVREIQAANKMAEKDTAIRAGQLLLIPRPAATPVDIVAMTLLGEGGTLKGASIMKEVMTVILNRSECRSMSLKDVIMERNQFSYWNDLDPDTVLYSPMGKEHKLWSVARDIAENKKIDPNVGGSTHYYVHRTQQVSESKRNYKEKPSWADKDNPKANWEEVYRGSHHTYGIDRSISHYRKCTTSS